MDGDRRKDEQDNDLDKMTGERLLSDCPVIVRRRVLWGECDPAGVVYTPRFADYLATAYGWFERAVLLDARRLDPANPCITPMKALTLEFSHVLRPGELFDMTVIVADIRERTFDLVIYGRSLAGEARFTGKLSPIVCGPDFRSMALPASMREALSAYQMRSATKI